jgi:Uncharacterized protein conserved in bacteria (DUF2188)
MTAETDPIKVFPRDGKWLVDYGSYAHGYHQTREEALEKATRAARDEQRELTVEADEKAVHRGWSIETPVSRR